MERKTPTKTQAIALARRMKERLRDDGIPVIDVYVFGSLARGNAHPGSDIDIAIVHRAFGANRTQERTRIRSFRDTFDCPMDILCFRPDDLSNVYLGIAQEVRKNGIPV